MPTKHVVLIGTHHGIQAGKRLASRFSGFVTSAARVYRCEAIAEEMSPEALEYWAATESVARRVATDMNLVPLYADPDRAERVRVGIPIPELPPKRMGRRTPAQKRAYREAVCVEHAMRENHWLDRIGELVDVERVLFICGAKHVATFTTLLRSRDIRVEVINDDWGNPRRGPAPATV